MEKCSLKCKVVTLCYLLNICWMCIEGASLEPMCSKFSYDEQLLEKMVRIEFYMENLEKEWRQNTSSLAQDLSEKQRETAQRVQIVSEELNRFIQQIKNFEHKLSVCEGNIANMTKLIEDRNKELQTLKGRPDIPRIAFSAREAADLTLQPNQVFVFKTVIMNYGDGYKPEDGKFYAPVDGLYQFNAHLCVEKGGKDLDYAILVESTPIISGEFRTPSDASDGKCVGFGAVGVVKKSEKVMVAYNSGTTYTDKVLFRNDNDWNMFSGVLINTL